MQRWGRNGKSAVRGLGPWPEAHSAEVAHQRSLSCLAKDCGLQTTDFLLIVCPYFCLARRVMLDASFYSIPLKDFEHLSRETDDGR